MVTTDAPQLMPEDWEMFRSIGRRLSAKQFDAFQRQGRGCGWCRQPIRIRGAVTVDDGMAARVLFSTASLPGGVTLKACGSRRETRCPACATVYRGDARHLVRAGLMGGKGVPENVAERPAALVTLTAPSFGVVHTTRLADPCHAGFLQSRCRHGQGVECSLRHAEDDEVVGSPLCPDCYDYEGAVLQNACTPELWRRTTIYVQRHLSSVLGRTHSETRSLVRLSFCRVAEYQRRGVVHLHAVIRADGPEGTPPPISDRQLAQAVRLAARAVSVRHPRGSASWGEQVDVQVLDRSDEQRAKRISTYVAKYATKSSESSGALDSRIRSTEELSRRHLPVHLRRMVETAWVLGGDPSFDFLHLRRHAHALGFGGHFLSKSRHYSTTLGALRAARQEWQLGRAHDGIELDEFRTSARWRTVGIGWANPGEATWAEWQRTGREEEMRCASERHYSQDTGPA